MKLHQFSFQAMGSACRLQFYAATQEGAAAQLILLQQELERLERKYSRFRHNSLLSRLNASAGSGASIELDQESAGLLDHAAACYEKSGGLFDVSSGALRECWNFSADEHPPQLPDDELLQQTLARVGWRRVHWNRPLLHLPEGMQLDLGAVVKEYAADRLARLAQRNGILHGLVELGGDIRVIGPHPDNSPWRIDIRHPQRPQQVMTSIELHEGALATCGTYERCFRHEDRLYHHILNPRTGRPVSGQVSVSVRARHCMLAGSAATIALLKEEQSRAWLQALKLPWLAISESFTIEGTLTGA